MNNQITRPINSDILLRCASQNTGYWRRLEIEMDKALAILITLTFPISVGAVQPGESRVHPTPIHDGQVVLVKLELPDTTIYGALVLENQRIMPERADYKWCLRGPGRDKFGSKHAKVRCGTSVTTNIEQISFEVFQISWDAHKEGMGWISYAHYPSDDVQQYAYQMCITNERNMEVIDPAHPKWIYRAKPPSVAASISNRVTGGL